MRFISTARINRIEKYENVCLTFVCVCECFLFHFGFNCTEKLENRRVTHITQFHRINQAFIQ